MKHLVVGVIGPVPFGGWADFYICSGLVLDRRMTASQAENRAERHYDAYLFTIWRNRVFS
ncbi:hypothetical protein BFP70_12625 [Thioclava sp. SK-1]|nr:hypothetical protein BFP70_12625 [Thioclava sp. SK-1]